MKWLFNWSHATHLCLFSLERAFYLLLCYVRKAKMLLKYLFSFSFNLIIHHIHFLFSKELHYNSFHLRNQIALLFLCKLPTEWNISSYNISSAQPCFPATQKHSLVLVFLIWKWLTSGDLYHLLVSLWQCSNSLVPNNTTPTSVG